MMFLQSQALLPVKLKMSLTFAPSTFRRCLNTLATIFFRPALKKLLFLLSLFGLADSRENQNQKVSHFSILCETSDECVEI